MAKMIFNFERFLASAAVVANSLLIQHDAAQQWRYLLPGICNITTRTTLPHTFEVLCLLTVQYVCIVVTGV